MEITKTTFRNDLGASAARVDRLTGELFLNAKMWPILPEETKAFIKFHEEGHLKLNTTDEFLADEYAFYQYAQSGLPLSKSIKALTRVLNFKNPEHIKRVKNLLRVAANYDFHVNKNNKAMNLSNRFASNDGTATSTGSGIPSVTPEQQAMNTGLSALGVDPETVKQEYISSVKQNPANAIPTVSAFNFIKGLFKKGSAWSKMNSDDKSNFVAEGLKYAFTATNDQYSAKDIFVEMLTKVGESDYDKWLSKNSDWIPNRIIAKEKEYQRKFTDKLSPEGSTTSIKSPQSATTDKSDKAKDSLQKNGVFNKLSIAFIAIAFILVIYNLLKKR